MSVVLEDVFPQKPAAAGDLDTHPEPANDEGISAEAPSPPDIDTPAESAVAPDFVHGPEGIRPPPPAPKKRGRPRKDAALPKPAPKPRAKILYYVCGIALTKASSTEYRSAHFVSR